MIFIKRLKKKKNQMEWNNVQLHGKVKRELVIFEVVSLADLVNRT